MRDRNTTVSPSISLNQIMFKVLNHGIVRIKQVRELLNIVTSIIYFLSHRKYLVNIKNHISKLSSIFPVSNYRIYGNK